MIEVGKPVLCMLRNNSFLKGIVEKWSNELIILKSLEDETTIIIHHGVSDIVCTKILPIEMTQTKSKIDEKIAEKLKEAVSTTDPTLKDKSLTELKGLKKIQDVKIINDAVQNHFANGPKFVNYNTPDFFKKRK